MPAFVLDASMTLACALKTRAHRDDILDYDIEQQKLFADLRQTIHENVSDPSERERLFERTDKLERAPDKSCFARTYAEFMALAADHMADYRRRSHE